MKNIIEDLEILKMKKNIIEEKSRMPKIKKDQRRLAKSRKELKEIDEELRRCKIIEENWKLFMKIQMIDETNYKNYINFKNIIEGCDQNFKNIKMMDKERRIPQKIEENWRKSKKILKDWILLKKSE